MQLFLKSVAIANLRHRILQGNMGINSVLGNSGCPTSLWMETQGDQKLHQRKKNAGTLYPDSPKESFSFRIFQRKGLKVLDSFLLSLKFEVAFHQIIAKTFYNSEELILQSKPLERKFHPNVPLGTPGYSSLDRENNSALVIILFEIHDNTWPQLRLRNNARWSYDVMIFTHA